ncbi:hypothetical protein Rru_A3286 [Rhodospirillum rubrum ATCC 11170]|uniref:Anti-sigma factor NepR domain-containing protein n=2 Tax=Rhodospirillum rubrum TaxID=1085 RepID=Q2RP64_RHORT|nr:hypothetical protein Rru_A3286 [Rhodospirillum rubrum ATCC 11170]MBK5955766.1 hypothetical protein [Rhodospirillum rubrum]
MGFKMNAGRGGLRRGWIYSFGRARLMSVWKADMSFEPNSDRGSLNLAGADQGDDRGRPASTPEPVRRPTPGEERWLGTYLRRAYDDVVDEPLPDSFNSLLKQLEQMDSPGSLDMPPVGRPDEDASAGTGDPPSDAAEATPQDAPPARDR